VYGFKFFTNAGSPDPVMTRHAWAVAAERAAGAEVRSEDGIAAATATAMSAARATAAPTPAMNAGLRERD
jgi:hypothetical protein